MTTFYLDYEGGNDANDGLSFANRWKTFTLGATAARIAPGDIIRVMGSPAPTSLGITGEWTNRVGGLAPTQNIVSSTNATPIVVTITGHGYANGDTLVITGHTTNTNANGTWEIANVAADTFELVGSTGNGVGGASGTARLRNNSRVKLASALTQNIASFANRGEGRVAWTASANVTATLDTTDFKCSDVSDSIAIAAAFTTGLAAYFPTGALDLSSKQQVSFWIKQTAGTVAVAGDVSLRLCSDAAGVTTVDTINIPGLVALNRWVPITVNTGAALGAAIQSIALYVDTDRGAQTFLISNVLACKAASSADSLTLTSLIGKNISTDSFYGIQSINGTRVVIDRDTTAIPTTSNWRGWSGTSETVATWKRETIKTDMGAASGTVINEVMDSGTDGNVISYEGGWNRTDMSTQTLETWFDGQNGFGTGLQISGKSFCSLNNIALCRYSLGINISSSSHITFVNVPASNNNSSAGFQAGTSGSLSFGTMGSFSNNNSIGLFLASSSCKLESISVASNNTLDGILLSTSSGCNMGTVSASLNNNRNGLMYQSGSFGNVVKEITKSDGNGNYGINFTLSDENSILSGSSSNNSLAGIFNDTGRNYFRNFTVSESNEVTGNTAFLDSRIYSEKHDGIADNHQIFTDGGLIRSETTVRHTASGISWAFLPTSTNRSETYPLDLSIAKIACSANALVTVKAWMRRTNAALTMRLVCKGGQLSGIPNDVVASMSAAADTWEEVTITFTPTEAGVVEITAEAFGGTTHTGYVDDLTITQA